MGGIYDGTYPDNDKFLREAMAESEVVPRQAIADVTQIRGLVRERNQLAARVRELERQQQSPPVYLQRIEELVEENKRLREALDMKMNRP